jgi:hypothetical protein
MNRYKGEDLKQYVGMPEKYESKKYLRLISQERHIPGSKGILDKPEDKRYDKINNGYFMRQQLFTGTLICASSHNQFPAPSIQNDISEKEILF